MRQIVCVLVAVTALAGVVAFMAPASGESDAEAAPIFGIKVPPGYRDWRLISVAREEGSLDDIRAVLGNDAAIKAYMVASWNSKFPGQPTSEATIKVHWLSPAKAEIDIGNAHEVFGAAEWTCISKFPPIVSGPYSVPARPW